MDKTLVLVSTSKVCKFYEAVGLKVKRLLKSINFDSLSASHKRQSIRTGFNKKGSAQTHSFDPHTDFKSLDRIEFCAQVVKALSIIDNADFSKIILLVADPKTLGVLRASLTKAQEQKLVKEINKDLVHLELERLVDFVF